MRRVQRTTTWKSAKRSWHASITFVSGKEGVSDFGGEAGAREAGKLRSEGKDYVVKDGDVMLFRFNV